MGASPVARVRRSGTRNASRERISTNPKAVWAPLSRTWQKHRVTNSAVYDAALRQRGSLTVWFTDEAIEAWRAEPRITPGEQPWYSPLRHGSVRVCGVTLGLATV